ncbi:alpha-amylase domain-containing protein [Wolbachia endosymbiont of Pentidionis agamae]|uniref:alpha-amylase domain-containing protein n=1 Tax=Wolbachia endosymbiont of Pentidionis agamae TaxID=3110435 RepID=UPI002FCEABD8
MNNDSVACGKIKSSASTEDIYEEIKSSTSNENIYEEIGNNISASSNTQEKEIKSSISTESIYEEIGNNSSASTVQENDYDDVRISPLKGSSQLTGVSVKAGILKKIFRNLI